MKTKLLTVALCGALSQTSLADNNSDHNGYYPHMKKYEVTITNAHAYHVLTPTVVTVHKPRFKLFTIANPASEGLAHQAENGDPSVLLSELDANPYVINATTNGELVPPGHSTTIEIMAPHRSRISVSSMLAGTNDAFIAVRGMKTPKRRSQSRASVYDAGSEANNEDCAFIPGPPCSPESGNMRATDDAEGFVTLSNGIHGIKDLSPQDSDWRGPVATVSIKRVHK